MKTSRKIHWKYREKNFHKYRKKKNNICTIHTYLQNRDMHIKCSYVLRNCDLFIQYYCFPYPNILNETLNMCSKRKYLSSLSDKIEILKIHDGKKLSCREFATRHKDPFGIGKAQIIKIFRLQLKVFVTNNVQKSGRLEISHSVAFASWEFGDMYKNIETNHFLVKI